MSFRVITSGACLAALLCSVVVMAQTNPEAEKIIKQRQDHLESLGDSFKVIRDQLRGDKSVGAITEAADNINTLAADIHSWFPAGTGPEAGVETEALPTIWEKGADFKKAADGLGVAAGEMLAAAKSGDLGKVGANVRTLGGACKNCHDNFRLDKD